MNFRILKTPTAHVERLSNIIHQLVPSYSIILTETCSQMANQLARSISVTLISRLMLNLHSTASTGILSTVPTSDTSGRVAFTTRVPDDIHFPVNGNDRDFEMQGTIPTQSLQAGAEHVVEEPGRHGIEMERRSGV